MTPSGNCGENGRKTKCKSIQLDGEIIVIAILSVESV